MPHSNLLSDEEQLGTRKLRHGAFHRRSEADARAPIFYAATLETRNFSFEAFGTTDESARDGIARLFAVHCRQYRLDEESFLKEFLDSVEVHPRFMGEGYRDGECLTGGR